MSVHGDHPVGWFGGTLVDPTPGGRGLRLDAAVIVKFGGSLLTLGNWPDRVAEVVAWIVGAGCVPTVVVGGGGMVESLRSIDSAAPMPPDRSHALALDCMAITGRIVSRALGLPIVAEPVERAAVLDAQAWLSQRAGAGLPESWHVTSDSIAAAVAGGTRTASGGTLILLKRTPPSCDGDEPGAILESLARSGWVDAHFPVAAAGVRVEWLTPSPSLP